jgi:hypothetical protein
MLYMQVTTSRINRKQIIGIAIKYHIIPIPNFSVSAAVIRDHHFNHFFKALKQRSQAFRSGTFADPSYFTDAWYKEYLLTFSNFHRP